MIRVVHKSARLWHNRVTHACAFPRYRPYPHPEGGRARVNLVKARGLGDVFQRFDLAVDGELLERVRLDLPHPLPRQPELPPDRL